MYYLWRNSNYIALQGVTYCVNFLQIQKKRNAIIRAQYTDYIKYLNENQELSLFEFDQKALGGKGGYCMAFFLNDD